MKSYLEVLYKQSNLVIVRDPDRKYPGIVFQGDTLVSIIGNLREALETLQSNELDETEFILNDLIANLEGRYSVYQKYTSDLDLPFKT